MRFNEYQKKTEITWISTGKTNDLARIGLGICDESGEVAGKLKKYFRKDFTIDKLKLDIKKELGDVLYYLARIATFFGLTLEEIAEYNQKKLMDRKKRGVLKGSGDNR